MQLSEPSKRPAGEHRESRSRSDSKPRRVVQSDQGRRRSTGKPPYQEKLERVQTHMQHKRGQDGAGVVGERAIYRAPGSVEENCNREPVRQMGRAKNRTRNGV